MFHETVSRVVIFPRNALTILFASFVGFKIVSYIRSFVGFKIVPCIKSFVGFQIVSYIRSFVGFKIVPCIKSFQLVSRSHLCCVSFFTFFFVNRSM